jgi:hypothetical protein
MTYRIVIAKLFLYFRWAALLGAFKTGCFAPGFTRKDQEAAVPLSFPPIFIGFYA